MTYAASSSSRLSAAIWLAASPAAVLAAQSPNLALSGRARSWLPSSVASVPTASVNDSDPLTFWGSNAPTTDPPKDIGIEWEEPQQLGCVRAKFYSLNHVPARDGWALEVFAGGRWQPVDATVANPECEWWTFRFAPVRATAVRLTVTKYLASRIAVAELEVFAQAIPGEQLRRQPLLDGAFWAFHYEGWAKHFATDAAIANEVDAAHAIGLDLVLLYTLTGKDGEFSTVLPGTVTTSAAPIRSAMTPASRPARRKSLPRW